MDLPTQALALGYLSLSWGFGTILGMDSIFTYHADLHCTHSIAPVLLHLCLAPCDNLQAAGQI